jgi:ABC-2 type transport system permease protein
VLGEPLPMLGMAVLGMAAFALTVGRTHRFFVHGLQQAAGSTWAAARPAGAVVFRFRRSLFDTVVVKEWRLIARDPHLLSQVLLQLVYLAPMLFLVLRKNDAPGPAIGAGLALLCSFLSGGAVVDHRSWPRTRPTCCSPRRRPGARSHSRSWRRR